MNSHFRAARAFVFVIVSPFFVATSAMATLYDLGTSGTATVNGAEFSTTSIQPTGTGVFDPFMTIQNKTSEQGYNSSTNNFDTKRVPQWNHELQVQDLQVTTIGNVGYYGFVVDINEPNSSASKPISLDALKIFTSSTLQSSTSTDALGHFNGSLGNLVFDLGNNSVSYTDAQHGSGSGDINIFVPVALFAGAKPTDYVYVYQRWNATQGGFEETATLTGNVVVPEPATALPVALLISTIAFSRLIARRFNRA